MIVMDHRINKAAALAFAQALADALSTSLSERTGSACTLTVAETQDAPAPDAQPCQFRIKLQGGLRGGCFLEFYEPHLSEWLARLGGDDPNVETNVGRAQALVPVLSQAATSLKSSLQGQYGELAFNIECVSGLACEGMFAVPLLIQASETPEASVFLYFDGILLDSLSAAAAGQEPSDSAGPAGPPFHPSNLRLVMDVELNVSLRFGQRQLPLREVLELGSGSVIELDRMVDDPVEMLLDGKVVARGEAVIVDGNYGLRVTEIPQALETHLSPR